MKKFYTRKWRGYQISEWIGSICGSAVSGWMALDIGSLYYAAWFGSFATFTVMMVVGWVPKKNT